MVQLGFHGKVVINKHTKIVSFVGKGNGTVANDKWSTSRVFIFVDVEQGIISVFASLSFNLFWVIYALIDTKHYVVSFKTERIWLALADLHNCVISAHNYGKAWNDV